MFFTKICSSYQDENALLVESRASFGKENHVTLYVSWSPSKPKGFSDKAETIPNITALAWCIIFRCSILSLLSSRPTRIEYDSSANPNTDAIATVPG